MKPTLRPINSITAIPAAQWNALAGAHPLQSHAFHLALESSGCVSAETGWAPSHLAWWREDQLAAAMPLYKKNNSYGEYVFDWSWARAYGEAGGRYYPKLTAALPFTPCPGARLMLRDESLRAQCVADALQFARDSSVSSLHILLCDQTEARAWELGGGMLRTGLQFHWENPGCDSFDAYLQTMTHDKRKRIKQDRRKVSDAGVTFRILDGAEIADSDWAHFYSCYAGTYAAHRSTPYLTLEFFKAFASALPAAQLLIIGERNGAPLCASLNWKSATTLYGRYWGTKEFVSGLHFESCYYQALAWCCAHGIGRFEGGAQGEHKLARGFLPTQTYSAHWIAHPQFANAVGQFLQRERAGVIHAINEFDESSPFKSDAKP